MNQCQFIVIVCRTSQEIHEMMMCGEQVIRCRGTDDQGQKYKVDGVGSSSIYNHSDG